MQWVTAWEQGFCTIVMWFVDCACMGTRLRFLHNSDVVIIQLWFGLGFFYYYTHTCTHSLTHTCTHSLTHTCTLTHPHMHTLTHPHMHMHTHSLTLAYNTPTHTYTSILNISKQGYKNSSHFRSSSSCYCTASRG